MSETKYLNKLGHFAKYLVKSFSMPYNSKSLLFVWKPGFSVNFDFITVLPELKYFLLRFFSVVIVIIF